MLLSSRFEDALGFAFRVHHGHMRKGSSVPYVTHLLAVASLVLENGADEDTAIAALLHDAVEDCGGPAALQKIRERFGERVAAMVQECSDTDADPKPPWRERKEKHVAEMASASHGAALVMAADKVHNARTMLADLRAVGPALWGRFRGGRDGTLWYYRAAMAALAGRAPAPLLEELARLVGELERASA